MVRMTKLAVLVPIALVAVSGCATKDWVRDLMGKKPSQWAVLADTEADIARFEADARWGRYEGATVTWTDDFSNLLRVLRWDRLTNGFLTRPGG